MYRAQLFLLALGIAIVLVAILDPAREAPLALLLDERPAAPADALGDPDLVMDGARIVQFRPDGSLQYRLFADSIIYYPDSARTLLRTPQLEVHGRDGPPWTVTADRGVMHGNSVGADAAARPLSAERVELIDSVHVRQQRPDDMLDLTTTALMLHPDTEYAETDQPVIISTDRGRTTARGLQADLDQGRMVLGTAVDPPPNSAQRPVHTILFPESTH